MGNNPRRGGAGPFIDGGGGGGVVPSWIKCGVVHPPTMVGAVAENQWVLIIIYI